MPHGIQARVAAVTSTARTGLGDGRSWRNGPSLPGLALDVSAPDGTRTISGDLASIVLKLGALTRRTPRAIGSTGQVAQPIGEAQPNGWRERRLGQGAPKNKTPPAAIGQRAAISVHEYLCSRCRWMSHCSLCLN